MTPQNKTISTILFIFGLLIITQSILLAVTHNQLISANNNLQHQIDGLIQENGEIRQENQHLSEKINQDSIASSSTAPTDEVSSYQNPPGSLRASAPQQNRQPQTAEPDNMQLQIIEDEIDQSDTISQTDSDHINQNIISIALLGIHDGLTDTIMLININDQKQKISLISIPRDLSYQGRKINEYYQKFGIKQLNKAIQNITGIAPDYYATVDLQLFTEAIDLIGGITVNIDKAITDNQYPGPNQTYQTVSFSPGIQTLNGTRALQYARTRKSTSDFDRAKRQQQILTAIKDKVAQLQLTTDYNKILPLFSQIEENLTTNINLLEAVTIFNQASNYHISRGNVISDQNYLYSTRNTLGQSILLPVDGNFQEIQSKILQII